MQEQIVRRKLADEVIDRLLKTIESGELKPGDQLPSERELMSRYGVGRPAIREALQTIENMGLITIHHGERARLVDLDLRSIFDLIDRSARHVLQNSPQMLEHLSEARLLFEVGMIRLAVKRGREADIVRLERALADLKASSGDAERFIGADMAFHTVIASFSGNPIYVALSESMLRWLFQYYPNLISVPGANSLTIAEHEAIYASICSGDRDQAVKAMTDHLTRANPLYRRYLAAGSTSGGAPSLEARGAEALARHD